MDKPLEKYDWWSYIHEDLQELLKESFLMIKIFGKKDDKILKEIEDFHDFAFIVFPAAKAYEGFLKTLFLDLGFIDSEDYYGKRFRIGKALNPSLDTYLRQKESVYDKLVTYIGGRELADTLWETWKMARNLLFHWFPNEKNVVTFGEAKERVESILTTIDLAYKECKINKA